MSKLAAVAALAVSLVLIASVPASAIPVFAHRYGLTCQACHTEVPHLTAFGAAFLSAGYRLPAVSEEPAFPVAVRTQLAYASAGAADPDASTTGPLPKTIVDEVELLTGGSAGPRGSYWAEAYVVDGGEPGRPRDVWYAYRATPDEAKLPVVFRVGQFTLNLPLDPETFRETTLPYAIWSQTAGSNPFTFFDVKMGGEVSVGDPGRSISGSLSFVEGHDTASTLPTYGVDSMVTLERDIDNVRLTAYRYDGNRQLAGYGFNNTQFFTGVGDRFWRNGFGVGYSRGDTEIDAVYQTGNDTAADVYGDALVTSGGFLQVRQALGERAFALARYDGTQDVAFSRTLTAGLGYRLSRNTRLTVFDTGQHDYTGRLLHIVSSNFLFAY